MELIQNQEALHTFCKDIAEKKWLALDTEFIREKTYYPNLCLIQIASDEHIVCIDTLAIEDLSILQEVIYSSEIVKVFHAASQDLEILFNLFGAVPTPIFDTQIAASALGYGDQISYAQLVSEICDVNLDKSLSRTCWDRRPLTDKEISYASNDVKYLAKIYALLEQNLEKNERSHWVNDECIKLSSPTRYEVDIDTQWKSVKGSGKLTSPQLIALKLLTSWREEKAMRRDIPRQWVLRDKILRELAIHQPEDNHALLELDGSEQIHDGHVDSIMQCIQQAKQTPENEWPSTKDTSPLSIEQRKLLKELQKLTREHAEDLNISPSLLATRKVLEKLIRGRRDLDILQTWKKDILGDDLVRLIDAHNSD